MKHSVLKFAAVLLCFSFFSCKKTITQASFYYWKTRPDFSTAEKAALKDLHVSTLYARFFDVDISKETGDPQPVGVIENSDSLPGNLQIVPVIFITNRTFLHLPKEKVLLLAKNSTTKINSIKNNYSELQFDCDWSGKTKENYFLFLNEIKKLVGEKIQVSCTIRLHQVKYAFKTGIPPVNRGVLMFYNMGDVSDPDEKNSIYNKNNAEKYSDFIKGYKLPLDAALPIFKWYVHYRNNKVIGLISKKDLPTISDTTYFSVIKNSPLEKGARGIDSENNIKFNVKTEHLENGIFYRTNDVLKSEGLSKKELFDAADLLKQSLKQEDRKLIFYDLDQENINYYGKETFTKIMAAFN